jgi:hypothetical protein
MTDYAVTNGRSASYPAKHYGALYPGGSVMTFCEDKDLLNPSANVLAIPTLPFSVITTSPFSVSSRFFGAHVKYRANDQLTGLTVGTVRSHDMENGKARWQFIQPTSSTWDWADLDSWVNTHYAAGRDILFTLFGTPAWASARPTEEGAYGPYSLGIQAEPSDMTKWDAFCTAIATRYLGKIKYYEVWNEPNYNNDGTGPTADGLSSKVFYFSGTFAKLSEMVRRANQAIKAVDPTAKIVSPPLTAWVATAGGTAETYLTGMMAASDGATGTMKNWVDIVGVHLYIAGNDITKLPGMIDRVKAGMATAGISAKEIWDTESAPVAPDVSGMSAESAKLFIVRSMIIQASKGIARTFYYQYDDPTMGFNRIPEISALREQIITMLRSTINTVSGFTDGRVAVYTDSLSMI